MAVPWPSERENWSMPEFAHYGFTSTRSLKPEHTGTILEVLRDLPDVDERTIFNTGAARGGDTFIARALIQIYPRSVHRLVVPAGYYNQEFVDGWLPDGRNRLVERMAPGTSYADRNARIVALCDRLVGFPLLEESSEPRSGTWQMVRMGKRAGRLFRLVVLEEEPDESDCDSTTREAPPSRGHTLGDS